MKIAITSNGAELDSTISNKLGTAPYLIILDTETWDYEVISNPGHSNERGAGVKALIIIVNKKVKKILTGYCNPDISRQLKENDIEVITGIEGNLNEVIQKYKKGILNLNIKERTSTLESLPFKYIMADAAKKSARQFYILLPIFIGIILLLGLFQSFVSKDILSSIFTGNTFLDTLLGACLGSIFAGNPINSYVIGGELLSYGVSLFAVTALLLTWVTVGLFQLPAEIAALGKKFALLRNGLAFILSIPATILTVLIFNMITT